MYNKNYGHSALTGKIIEASFLVHNQLGFGFLESVYEKALTIELRKRGFEVFVQHPISVFYEDEEIGIFKADLLVNQTVIVELKAVDALHPKHEVQLVNYLKATEIEYGLLINFGEKVTIKRKIFTNDRK